MTHDPHPELIDFGHTLLAGLTPADDSLQSLQQRLGRYAMGGFTESGDAAGWVTCILALASVVAGNYGIGALILNQDGEIVIAGHNQIIVPYFRSDAHAEMVVLTDFETRYQNRDKQGLSLYTSLEPCPMCYTRILTSGMPAIYHVADDQPGGMVSRADTMPEYWRTMQDRHVFARASVRDELRTLSLDILNANINDLDATLRLRSF